MYNFKAVNIEKFDKSKKYSENTVFYKTEDN